jgi:broad specificity phosphatase PhoE
MAKLILIKHAPPQISADVASPRWVLSASGRERCGWLADELQAQGVRRLYASLEPKALETAALAAVHLGLEMRPRPDLHENDRTGLGFLPMEDLKARIRRFFASPEELVIGRETARMAEERFEAAVRAIVAETPEETAAIVAHGTVLTLLTAKYNPIDPYGFWEALGLPSYVVLETRDFGLLGDATSYPG